MKPVLTVKTDPLKNRMSMKMSGSVTVVEARQFRKKLVAQLARLKAGFTLLNDTRDFKPTTSDVLQVVEGIMESVISAKPSKVARIVSSGFEMTLKKISSRPGYKTAAFLTPEEAVDFLDS